MKKNSRKRLRELRPWTGERMACSGSAEGSAFPTSYARQFRNTRNRNDRTSPLFAGLRGAKKVFGSVTKLGNILPLWLTTPVPRTGTLARGVRGSWAAKPAAPIGVRCRRGW